MFQINPAWFRVDPWLIAVIAIGIAVALAITIIWGIRAHRHQVSAGREELIGRTAEVKITLEPKGVVFVDGERWAAISDKDRIETGETVIITKVDGLKLYVIKKE